MGSFLSTLAVDVDNISIEEILVAVIDNFGCEFEGAFKFNVVQTITSNNEIEVSSAVLKAGEAPDAQVQYCLKQASVSIAPLKVGVLTKRGEQFKSWKRRHFQALNATDNYAIAYYSDPQCKRELGRIACCG